MGLFLCAWAAQAKSTRENALAKAEAEAKKDAQLKAALRSEVETLSAKLDALLEMQRLQCDVYQTNERTNERTKGEGGGGW